jgi:hypothetical protein
MNYDPRSIPPPIGARVNVPPQHINNPPMSWTVSTIQATNLIPPPIGSAPVNMMGQTIQPPVGSEPANLMGQAYPSPTGAAVHPATCPANPPSSYGLNPGAHFDEHNPAVPPPIGSHPANMLAGCVIQPPIGSAPVHMLAGQPISPPVGSAPTNYMGQAIQPPMGAAVNPPPGDNLGYRSGPDPTASTFSEARFYAEHPMIPPPIGAAPANQLSGAAIPPPTTWVMRPNDQR